MSSASQKRQSIASSSSKVTPDVNYTQEPVERLVDDYLKKKLESGLLVKDKSNEKKHQGTQTQANQEGNTNKISKKNFTAVKENLPQPLLDTNLPHLKYTTEGRRLGGGIRYLRLLVFLISLLSCCYFIRNSYTKWQSSSVLLSYNDSMTPIKAIPFPAVTICPGRQLSPRSIADVRLAVTECTSREACSDDLWNLLTAGRLLCPKSLILERNEEDKYLDGKMYRIIEGLSSSCVEDTITWFRLNGDSYSFNCSSYFQKIFLEGETCFSFNMLPARDLFNDNIVAPMVDDTQVESKPNWTLDDMLQLSDLSQSVPRHIDSNGLWAGLYFGAKKPASVEDDLCGKSSKTMKIVFHHPGEFPLLDSHEFFDLPPGTDMFFRLSPRLTTSSPELRSYKPEGRKCHYSNELKLMLFRTYTQQNCQLECRVNCSLRLCDCVPFYFPRLNGSNMCGRQHTKQCVEYILPALLGGRYSWKEVVLKFRESLGDRIQEVLFDYLYDRRGNTVGGSLNVTEDLLLETDPDCRCDCPIPCTSLGYRAEVVQQKRPGSEDVHMRVAVSFKEMEFTSMQRKELTGLTDFIADLGGLLGVFTGITFLAVGELLYNMTLGLWRNIKIKSISNRQENAKEEDFDTTIHSVS